MSSVTHPAPVAAIAPSSIPPLAYDPEPTERRVGLVVLSTDHTTEVDYARMLAGPRVGVYASRVAYENPVTEATLRRTLPELTRATSLILPDERLDVVCYSCTSASLFIGDEAVADAIRAAKPGVPVLTPTKAAAVALAALGVRRISLLTPYLPQTAAPFPAYFAKAGFEVVSAVALGLEDDRQMARLDRDTLVAASRAAMHDRAEALFLSCTGVRAAGFAREIEAAIGRPLVSSNIATAWAASCMVGEPLRTEARLREAALPAGAFA